MADSTGFKSITLGEKNHYLMTRVLRAITMDRSAPGAHDVVVIHTVFKSRFSQPTEVHSENAKVREFCEKYNKTAKDWNDQIQEQMELCERYLQLWWRVVSRTYKCRLERYHTNITSDKEAMCMDFELLLSRKEISRVTAVCHSKRIVYRLDDVDAANILDIKDSELKPLPELSEYVAGPLELDLEACKAEIESWINSYTTAYAWKAARRYVRMRHVALFWWGKAMERHCALGGEGRKADKRSFDEMEGTTGSDIELPPAVRVRMR